MRNEEYDRAEFEETQKKNQFMNDLRRAGADTIARFLRVASSDVTALTASDELDFTLSQEYDNLSEIQVDQFDEQMKADTAAKQQAPRWAEIRYDHHEETDGFLIGFVDAWKSNDDNEDGRVIAQVIGAKINGKDSVYVAYCDPEARVDENANEAIAACALEVKAALAEANN